MSRGKTLLAWLVGLAVVAVAGSSTLAQEQAADPGFGELSDTIESLARKKPGNSVVGVTVTDVTTGAEIFALGGDEQLNPASNAKIVTAAVALKVLGPEFEFQTSLHGKRDGNTIRGPIYIKGHGDPSLSTADLWQMVREVKAMGIRRVEAGVVVDDTYFDDQNLPYAFDRQPDEDNKFRSPVGAVSLNHNALSVTIRPAAQGMTRARVVLDPPGYAVLTNDTVTVGQGAHNPKISCQTFEDRTRVRVWGQVPLGARPVTYFRRIDNPSLFTGYGLKAVLEEVGISVGGDVRVGPLLSGTPMLAEHYSPPLSSVLWESGKLSNNFVTETVFKTVGAESGEGPGTWEKSIAAAAEVLDGWGIPAGSYTYRNGSGLFDANLFSARQFVRVLRAAYLDSGLRPEFLAQLATGGVDGTIKQRYRHPSARRRVRAKTGTLADVSALSGFVFDAQGRRPIAFSILVNKAPGYVSSARSYQEKIVTAIAKHLNP
ncbi:MAG: D-alanyl-D-alanine carboxypeptidase/D-alanyl-D-alanine-endopeptidase [Deltaproteobacteria bacterium]|nr:D-alanyl-D-alanine carboxypeptidase/D-alanyl-D-alanine-endopeptidase [Deltaproteobacteria bacterium]